MSFEAETQEFLDYLHANESVRSLIKAAPNKTLLYSGGFFQSIFNELEMEKRKNANLARLQTLSDVLARAGASSSKVRRPHVEAVCGGPTYARSRAT